MGRTTNKKTYMAIQMGSLVSNYLIALGKFLRKFSQQAHEP